MIRFIETVRFDANFAKKVYALFFDPRKGKCNLYWRAKFKSIKGWPEGLDTENLEIVSFTSDSLTYWAGGDWQEGAEVTLQLDLKGGKLRWLPFDAYIKKSSAEIKNAVADLEEQGRSLIESARQEDCQIAGTLMGDLPQNAGNVLSLGYKNGRILPAPKKKQDSRDYPVIPHF
jgi:hypothetical protein